MDPCIRGKVPKIYTKKGDKGMTSLYNGKRVGKNNYIVHTLGKLDEFNVRIGAVKILLDSKCDIYTFLEEIQHDSMNMSSVIATPGSNVFEIKENLEKKLENKINHYTGKMPPLRNFVLPGGNELSVRTHFARVQARECERFISGLPEPDPKIQKYFNRMSDYLFTLSRWFSKNDDLHK